MRAFMDGRRVGGLGGMRWGLISVAVLCAGLAAEDRPVRLTDRGRPVAVVVVPDGAGFRSDEGRTAEMLAEHIERMSGAKLDVRPESAINARIFDGLLMAEAGRVPPEVAAFVLVGEGELAKGLGVSAEGLGVGGIRVKTTGNAVVLLGGPAGGSGHRDPDGLRYAAVELLEHFGWRYLWPGETGLVVPDSPTVEIGALDVTYTPPIGGRSLRWGRLEPMRGVAGLERLGVSRLNWQRAHDRAMEADTSLSWREWQRSGGRMPNFGHAGAGLRNAERYMREKPEWFALQADGTRDQGGDPRWRLCKSNPELIAHVAADIVRQANEDPDLTLISLCPNDGGSNTGWCLCRRCTALDPRHAPKIEMLTFGERAQPGRPRRSRTVIEHVSLTDRMVFYWNAIAERVSQAHPDLRLGITAYSHYSRPPVERSLHPNLFLRYVPSELDDWEGWRRAGARRMFWRPNILLDNWRHGKAESVAGLLARNMNALADAGVNQVDFDAVWHHWSTFGINYYVAARLSWNPRLSFEEILADFASSGFGPGARFIESYFRRIEQLSRRGVHARHESPGDYRYTPQVAAGLRRMLNSAERAAGDDEAIRARIAFLRMGLNMTELHEMLDDLSRRARANERVDMNLASLLVDLNCLVLRDILHNHHLAVNVPSLVQMSGGFARWRPVEGRRLEPLEPTLLQRVGDPRYGLTGREQGVRDMLRAFGLM